MASVNDVPSGRYRIYNAQNVGATLTVSNASARNGSNVLLCANGSPERDCSFSDVWDLTYRGDGTAQLLNVYSGKSLDVNGGNVALRTNVQIWTDNDGRAQQWDLVPSSSGRKASVGGVSYETYFLAMHANRSMVCDVQGYSASSGSNVQLYTTDSSESGSDQLWAFVPVPTFEVESIYELRSMMNTSMTLAIGCSSQSDGAGAIMCKVLDINDQKLYIATEGTAANGRTKHSLRMMHSGKYVDAYGGATVSTHVNQRVCQFEDNDGSAQRWNVTKVGSTKVGGVTCDVVSIGSFVTDDGTSYYMDADKALHGSSPTILLQPPSGTTAQQWALYPTTAEDDTMPVPVSLGLVREVGSTDGKTQVSNVGPLYPTWECTDAWATSGPNHYEWRRRYRRMSANTSTWDAWTEWSGWATAACTMSGKRAWLTQGIPENEYAYEFDECKNVEWEFQVRAVGAEETSIVHGRAADVVFRITKTPSISLTKAGFHLSGLRVGYESDYSIGTNVITVSSVTNETSGLTVIDNVSMRVADLDESSSIEVGIDSMGSWVNDGDTLRITYASGNDQWDHPDEFASATVRVSYDEGHGFTLDPAVTMGAGRMLTATANALDENQLWLYCDGEARQVDGTVSDGKATYSIPYPFDRSFSLWFEASSEDGDTWGTAMHDVRPTDAVLADNPPCHAWNWGSGNEGSFTLEANADSPLETKRTLSPVYEAYSLNGRARQSVRFGGTVAGTFEAEGLLYEGLTESTVADLIAMQRARHVTYRAPSGETCEVAIVDVQYTRHREYTIVQIQMIEETV